MGSDIQAGQQLAILDMSARLAHDIPHRGTTAQTFDTSPCDDDVGVFYFSV